MLLSPAAPSFSQFRSWEERSAAFADRRWSVPAAEDLRACRSPRRRSRRGAPCRSARRRAGSLVSTLSSRLKASEEYERFWEPTMQRPGGVRSRRAVDAERLGVDVDRVLPVVDVDHRARGDELVERRAPLRAVGHRHVHRDVPACRGDESVDDVVVGQLLGLERDGVVRAGDEREERRLRRPGSRGGRRP